MDQVEKLISPSLLDHDYFKVMADVKPVIKTEAMELDTAAVKRFEVKKVRPFQFSIELFNLIV